MSEPKVKNQLCRVRGYDHEGKHVHTHEVLAPDAWIQILDHAKRLADLCPNWKLVMLNLATGEEATIDNRIKADA